MKNRRMRGVCRALIVAALLPFAAWAVGAQADERDDWPEVVRIASPDLSAGRKPFAGQGTLSLAHISGSLQQRLEEEGVRVEWSFFKGAGPAVNEAFANGRIDIAFLGDLAAIIGRAAGNDSRVLLGSRGSNTYLAVPADSEIDSLADLRGKRVGVFRGTADQLAFGRALQEVGLGERDLRVINLDWAAGKAALAANQVDAIWQGVSVLALEREGIARVPASTKDVSRLATTQAVVLGAGEFIERYPELTQLIVDELVKEAQAASQPGNLEGILAAFSEQSDIPLALFQQDFADTDAGFRFSPRQDAFLRHSLGDSIEQARALGLIRRTFELDDWLEPRFVDDAVQRLGLHETWTDYDERGEERVSVGARR